MNMNKILKIQNLTKNFGNVSAVSNVSIEVEEGTIHSIIGPNGAGKSTFFNMISGVIPPSEGNVYYKDKDITGFESAIASIILNCWPLPLIIGARLIVLS